MSMNTESKVSFQEIHRLGRDDKCEMVVYGHDSSADADDGSSLLQVEKKSLLIKMSGTGCNDKETHENPGLSNRVYAGSSRAASAGERAAWFALSHNRVEETSSSEGEEIRVFGGVMLDAALDRIGQGDTLQEARDAVAKDFFTGEVQLPAHIVEQAEAMATEPVLGLESATQQTPAL